MSWIEVRAHLDSAPDDWSVYVEIFRDHGVENTMEEGNALVGCLVQVEGTPDRLEELAAALSSAGLTVTTGELPEVNWELAWRQFFKPRRIGKRFVIRPTWEEFESQPGDLVIVLDPGQAFGTGDHATTRLCLELLEAVDLKGKRVADVGCGSGILSIGAVLLGASIVEAVDIEAQSVEVTRENRDLNNVSFLAEVADGFDGLPLGTEHPEAAYDLVVSNIISATLIRVAPDAADVVKPGGAWIVSGVIPQNWPDVLEAAERAGFELKEKREEDGWVAARYERV